MDRITGCEIEFGLYDVTAHADSTSACADKQPFVNLSQLKQDELKVENYMTGERNHNVLDGSMKLFPDEPQEQNFGLWSASMSDADGLFSVPVVLDVTFTQNHSSIGLTFRFQEFTNDYCNHLNIQWYNSAGTKMADQNFYPNSAYYLADHKVEDYRRVTVTFYRTNRGGRYLKLTEVIYGAIRVLGERDLISASVLEEIDPISTQLSINTLNFKLHSGIGEYSILDMQGVWSLLQWKQRMRVREVLNGQKIQMGTYYLDEPEADTENTTTMQCVDLLGIIDQTDFKGGMYTNALAGDIVSAIMISAGEPDGFEMETSLKNMRLSGWIPICTHREALQQVAFAVGAIVDCSRSEQIKLYPVPTVTSGVIGKNRKIIGHKVKMSTLVTGVEVTAHSYVQETAADKEQELQNGELPIGVQEITFSSPMHSLTVTGATIAASNVNYAKLTVATAGMVVLKGKPYNDNKAIFATYMPELPANQKPNVLKVEDATLISTANAKAVSQRVYDYYQNRYQDTGDIILSQEQAGQLQRMDNMNNRQIAGYVESLDIDLTGGFLATAKVTGKAVNI